MRSKLADRRFFSSRISADAYHNLAVAYLYRGERQMALEQYARLKSFNRERAVKLFEVINQDRILRVGKR